MQMNNSRVLKYRIITTRTFLRLYIFHAWHAIVYSTNQIPCPMSPLSQLPLYIGRDVRWKRSTRSGQEFQFWRCILLSHDLAIQWVVFPLIFEELLNYPNTFRAQALLREVKCSKIAHVFAQRSVRVFWVVARILCTSTFYIYILYNLYILIWALLCTLSEVYFAAYNISCRVPHVWGYRQGGILFTFLW